MEIHESGENYLETILMLKQKIGQVRAIDIVRYLNFSKPTVDKEGYIILTEKGIAIAERIYERHVVIAKVLMVLGVDEDTAYEDSCRIEHDISDKTFQCIKQYYLQSEAVKDN